MDAIISSALEELCSAGPTGLAPPLLFSKLTPSISLPLTPSVKQSIWTNLLAVPSLNFINNSVNKPVTISEILSLKDAEKFDLAVIANESLLDCFVGVYDVQARDGFKGFNADMRNTLQRLASARGNGITQSQLAREFGKGGNGIFYILRNLECQGLVTRQTAVVHTSEEGDIDSKTAVTTNMVYLSRYAKNLGSQQRLEINQEKRSRCDGSESGINEECVLEDVSVKDYVPAMKAICDKLAAAVDNDLFVKDIKQALGYRNGRAHKLWRIVSQRLIEAGIVKEYSVMIENKTFVRLKLLREFSEKFLKTKYSEGNAEDLNLDVANQNNSVISEQLVELPLENQIYDIIDATGSKGLTLVELCERLGINNKRYYNTFINIFSRYGMPCREEGHKKGMVYRVWTSRNLTTVSSNSQSTELDEISPSVNANLGLKSDDSASHYARVDDSTWDPICDHQLQTGADADHIELPVRPSHTSTRDDLFEMRESENDKGMSSCNGDIDLQLVAVDNENVTDIVPSENIPKFTSVSLKKQPHHKDPALAAKREQRIVERLQEDKFIVRAELQRWLESLETDKHSAMDSRTLNRLLGKLQEQGLCKCCKVGVPFSSNCRGQRTKDVVLHPSIQRITPEIAAQIQERLRFHELECRTRVTKKSKDDLLIPVVDGIHSPPVRIVSDEKTQKFEKMIANGFIISKMIRAKLLHIFLWHNLNDAALVNSSQLSNDLANPCSTCQFFVMDDVIKAMPVDLFCQVVGLTRDINETTQKCLCLKDLPVQEYKSLIDSLAIARLSGVFDILRRLSLIQLLTEVEVQEGDHLLLHPKFKYAFEQNPYIEEPRPTFSTCSNPASLDLRPLIRHNFELKSKETVDDYWKTLEYLYSAADQTAASHAFPGSSVPELFRFRSWSSYHLMTAEKRSELCKRLENNDPEAKISVKDCEKLAKDLDLTVQQVLAYKNKRMNRNQNRSENDFEDIMEEFEHPKSHRSSTSRKRERHPNLKGKCAGSMDHDAFTNNCNIVDQFVEDEPLLVGHDEEQGIDAVAYLENCRSEENPTHPLVGEDKHHPFADQSLYPSRKPRFSWNPEADRHLVIQYARHRAALGARFHHTEWTSFKNPPAPPSACRRRMALLKGIPEFRTSLMKLLNILSKKYITYLKKSKCKVLNNSNQEAMDRDITSPDPLEEDGDKEENWDDFDCEDIKAALDEVLQHIQVSKIQKGDEGQRNEKRQRKSFSGNQSRARIPRKLVQALSKGGRGCKQVYESLAVSNAVELFKLVFLSTLTATEVPNIVAETLRKYSEQDLFAAFNYLREKKILVGGTGGTSFELSQYILQRFSASPFPADTGERASQFVNWIHEKENDLIDEGIDLIPNLECGDIIELFSLVAAGELSVTPCLPDDGVGEPEESSILKRQADDGDLSIEPKAKKPKRSSMKESELSSRREKGFPGMKVILNRMVFSSVSDVGCFPDMKNANEDDKHLQEGPESDSNLIPFDNLGEVLTRSCTNHSISDLTASPWETMVEYATCLTSKSSDQTFSFHSEIFKDIYEAIKMAGDQGLTLNEISDFIDKQGKSLDGKMTKMAIEILESFGLTIQVNAYDTVRVVDSQYRSKYLLTVAGSSSTLQQPSKYQVGKASADLVIHKDQHALYVGSEFPLADTCVGNSHAHSVTILDAPAEVPSSSNENINNHGDTFLNIFSTNSGSYVPILPWMNGDGTINKSIYKGLVRRVIGSIMQNPGMLEDDIIRKMDVLNPQSCRKLLELLILENHIIVRKMRQVRSGQPPSILGNLLKKNLIIPSEDAVWRKHFFINPASSHLL